MLVGGEEVQEEDKILNSLRKLPSSFPEYNNTKELLNCSVDPNAVLKFSSGLQSLNSGKYKEARKQFEDSLNDQYQYNKNENNLFTANLYNNIAYTFIGQGDYKKAEEYLSKSNTIRHELQDFYSISNNYKTLASLYQAQGKLKDLEDRGLKELEESKKTGNQYQELHSNFILASVASAKGDYYTADIHYSNVYKLNQGPVDYDAHRVEQREVAFSSDQKIGTDNILQCVAVIIHDPLTKKTALAHFDKFTDPKSLIDVINEFPPDRKLNVYLTGGRDISEQGRQTSNENIHQVLTELKKHSQIDIKAADIGNRASPSAIVFDPKTSELKHAAPGKEDKSHAARLARVYIPSPSKEGKAPLNFAFDFTKSDIIPDITFSEPEQKNLINALRGISQVPADETWKAAMRVPILKVLSETLGSTMEEQHKLYFSKTPAAGSSLIDQHTYEKPMPYAPTNDSASGDRIKEPVGKRIKDLSKTAKTKLDKAIAKLNLPKFFKKNKGSVSQSPSQTPLVKTTTKETKLKK